MVLIARLRAVYKGTVYDYSSNLYRFLVSFTTVLTVAHTIAQQMAMMYHGTHTRTCVFDIKKRFYWFLVGTLPGDFVILFWIMYLFIKVKLNLSFYSLSVSVSVYLSQCLSVSVCLLVLMIIVCICFD